MIYCRQYPPRPVVFDPQWIDFDDVSVVYQRVCDFEHSKAEILKHMSMFNAAAEMVYHITDKEMRMNIMKHLGILANHSIL